MPNEAINESSRFAVSLIFRQLVGRRKFGNL
jgi:hypothetical protein